MDDQLRNSSHILEKLSWLRDKIGRLTQLGTKSLASSKDSTSNFPGNLRSEEEESKVALNSGNRRFQHRICPSILRLLGELGGWLATPQLNYHEKGVPCVHRAPCATFLGSGRVRQSGVGAAIRR